MLLSSFLPRTLSSSVHCNSHEMTKYGHAMAAYIKAYDVIMAVIATAFTQLMV